MDKTRSSDIKEEPVKSSNNDLFKFRNISQSSEDDQSKSSNFDVWFC